MSKDKPGYYAILTADVRYDQNLKAIEKLLFAEITALSNKHGKCWSTNGYFAELYGVSKTSISKYISNLQKQGYVNSVMIYKDNSKEIDKRYLYINNTPIAQKLNTPIEHSFKDNTTSNNNTRESKSSPVQDKPKQLTPEEKEVEEYKQHLKQQKSDYPDDWVMMPNGSYRPPHAKDKYKDKDQVNANPDDLKHVDFVKEYAAGAYEKQIKMRYAAKIKDRDSFIRKFNNKCVIKEVPFKTSTILAEMENFAITWLANQK